MQHHFHHHLLLKLELNDYFLSQNKVVISDVDTRSLVKYIRNKGAMNAIISSETLDIEELKSKLLNE